MATLSKYMQVMDTLSKDMQVIEDNIAMHAATLEELLYRRIISLARGVDNLPQGQES